MAASHVVAQGFAYGSLILLARWLPPASFGTIAVGTAIVYIAVLLIDRGTWGGIIVQSRLARTDLAHAFRRCLLTGIVLAVGMAAAAEAVVDRFASGGDAAAVAVLALCLPLHAISVVPMALLQRSMQFRRLGGLTAVANIASATTALLMAMGGLGVWALVARQVLLSAGLALLSSALCLTALRTHQISPQPTDSVDRAPTQERWFFLFAVTLVVTVNLDYLVIGHSANATVVGLYALAFTIAMAPCTHFSDQVGKVLFAAAATQPETVQQRTEQAVQLMSTLMLPLLPVGILAAPTVLPAVFGPEWEPMVVPFQILLAVGVGHAIVNCIGEALSGNGHIAFRAKVMVARCAVTLPVLIILVSIDGMRGAALGQLLLLLAYAAIYAMAGARRAGTSPAALWRRLHPIAVIVGFQTLVGCGVLVVVAGSGPAELAAACAAAVVGLAAGGPLLLLSRAWVWSR
ncbi:MAG TPA: oligosaccharide flippase family protein [Mycobacterium sp.]|nr:oligosaccharide flippase family protein [Mycobacterium sp.]